MKIFITGDSHVVAIGNALAARGAATGAEPHWDVRVVKALSFPLTLHPFFAVQGDTIFLADVTARDEMERSLEVRGFQPCDDTVYALSLPYTTSILLWNRIWETQSPWRSCGASRTAVSDAAMRAIVADHYQHIFAFLDALQRLRIRFFVIEAPPPRRDDTHSRERLPTAIEVDRLARETVDVRLNDLGIDIVHCPPAFYAGAPRASFLRDDLRRRVWPDCHHANEIAGGMMLDCVLQHCRGLAAAA